MTLDDAMVKNSRVLRVKAVLSASFGLFNACLWIFYCTKILEIRKRKKGKNLKVTATFSQRYKRKIKDKKENLQI